MKKFIYKFKNIHAISYLFSNYVILFLKNYIINNKGMKAVYY